MKHHYLLTLLVSLLLNTSSVFSQLVPFSFSGTIENWNTKSKEHAVTVYFLQEGRTLSRSLSKENGSYVISAKIDPSKKFELYFAKPNMVTKKALFDFSNFNYKKIVKNNKNNTYEIKTLEQLNVDLFKTIKDTSIDFSFLKTEYIAEFRWDGDKVVKDEDKFKNVSKKIEDLLNKAKEIENKRNKFDSFVNSGNLAFSKDQLEKAIENYDSALVIKSDDKIKTKIESVKKEIEKREASRKLKIQIDNFITSGDSLQNLNQLEDAKSNYEKALSLDNKNAIIKNKIKDVSAQMAYNDKLEKYKKKFDEAKKNETAKEYDLAIANYKECLQIIPNKKNIILDQIKKINLIKKQISIEEEANKIILEGDAKVNAVIPNYKEAIQLYTKALNHVSKYPNSKIIKTANEKIKKANNLKKSSSLDTFNSQIKIGNEAFNRGGRSGLETVKKVLDNPILVDYKNDPKFKNLEKKFKAYNAFLRKKDAAYLLVKQQKLKPAIDALNTAEKFSSKNKKLIPSFEGDAIIKSRDSIANIIKANKEKPNINDSDTTKPIVKENILPDLGVPSSDSTPVFATLINADLFNKNSRKSPLLDGFEKMENERIFKNEMNYYSLKTNENKADEIILNKTNSLENQQIQFYNNLMAKIHFSNEIKIFTEKKHQENTANIVANEHSNNEIKILIDSLNIKLNNHITNNQKEIAINNNTILENQKIVLDQKNIDGFDALKEKDSINEYVVEVNIKKNESMTNNLVLNEKAKDSINYIEINEVKKPNYLKNSNGEQYKIGITEEKFIKGSKIIITRRVIVDENYHGDVYLKYESLNSLTTYFKNGQSISKDKWVVETEKSNLVKN